MARITTANAREMAARSHAARHQRQIQRYEQAAASQHSPQSTGYVTERLARVRVQIESVDRRLVKAETSQDVERLARALAALSELERVLDGRPLPGSRRPGKERVQIRELVEPL